MVEYEPLLGEDRSFQGAFLKSDDKTIVSLNEAKKTFPYNGEILKPLFDNDNEYSGWLLGKGKLVKMIDERKEITAKEYL